MSVQFRPTPLSEKEVIGFSNGVSWVKYLNEAQQNKSLLQLSILLRGRNVCLTKSGLVKCLNPKIFIQSSGIKLESSRFWKGCCIMTFKNSGLVKTWVSLVLCGVFTLEQVPNLFNHGSYWNINSLGWGLETKPFRNWNPGIMVSGCRTQRSTGGKEPLCFPT